jgi:ribosome-associated toxin RatA of RatAB toxin-antitoxin module
VVENTNSEMTANFQAFDTDVEGDRPSPDLTTTTVEIDPKLLDQVQVSSERVQGRQRRICASIQVPRSVDQVWQVLTDYNGLSDFIPNLSKSRRLDTTDGSIRIEQVGAQCWLNLKFCARVVLEMQEQFPQEICFRMVEGDFKDFSGAWRLAPQEINGQAGTVLEYDLVVLPRLTMPIALIERHLRHNLAVNLVAIQQRAIACF